MPKKFTDLAELSALDDADIVAVVDTSANTSKKITMQTLRALITPAGMIAPYAGSSAPTGWLLCDGSAVSRSTYAGLFAAIGTSYGTGDGSTTFNLPNLKGKVAVGRDSGQTEFDNLGETGGAKTHTLTLAQIPNATGSLGLHSGERGSIFVNRSGVFTGGTVAANYIAPPATSGGSQSIYGQIDFSLGGGGQAHNNLQPYVVTNHIIKT